MYKISMFDRFVNFDKISIIGTATGWQHRTVNEFEKRLSFFLSQLNNMRELN